MLVDRLAVEAGLLLWFLAGLLLGSLERLVYCCVSSTAVVSAVTPAEDEGTARAARLHSHGTCRRRVGRTAGEGMEAVGTDNTSDVMRSRRACFCFPKALEASNIDRQECRSRERRHGIERVTNRLSFVISYETGDIG